MPMAMCPTLVSVTPADPGVVAKFTLRVRVFQVSIATAVVGLLGCGFANENVPFELLGIAGYNWMIIGFVVAGVAIAVGALTLRCPACGGAPYKLAQGGINPHPARCHSCDVALR